MVCTLQIQDDIAFQMVSALDEYGHHSTKKTNDISIETENVVLVSVKVSANSSVSWTCDVHLLLSLKHRKESQDLSINLKHQSIKYYRTRKESTVPQINTVVSCASCRLMPYRDKDTVCLRR